VTRFYLYQRWQSRLRRFTQAIAVLLTFTFVVPYLTWAFEPASLRPGQILFHGQTLEIPRNLGMTVASHQGQNRLVIYIQDLHCNYEIQSNISRMLDLLARHTGLKLVGVEGAAGTLDMAKLSTFPLASVKKRVADYLLRQGKITGMESYAALGQQPVVLEGLEDDVLYQDNRQAIGKFLNDENQGLLLDLREALNIVKPMVYNQALQAIDRRKMDFREGRENLTGYCAWLGAYARQASFTLSAYPLLNQYLVSKKSSYGPEIDSDRLLQEMENLDRELRAHAYTRADQRELDQLQHRLDLMEKLLNISAAPEELAEFRKAPELFKVRAFREFIERHNPEAAANLAPEVDGLNAGLEHVKAFYAVADRRSTAFIANLENRMAKHGTDVAVMVLGGYHAPEMKAEFDRRGWSYLCVRPVLTHEDVANPYFSLLRGRKTPLEKLLDQNQNIFQVARPFAALGGKAAPDVHAMANEIDQLDKADAVREVFSQGTTDANALQLQCGTLFSRWQRNNPEITMTRVRTNPSARSMLGFFSTGAAVVAAPQKSQVLESAVCLADLGEAGGAAMGLYPAGVVQDNENKILTAARPQNILFRIAEKLALAAAVFRLFTPGNLNLGVLAEQGNSKSEVSNGPARNIAKAHLVTVAIVLPVVFALAALGLMALIGFNPAAARHVWIIFASGLAGGLINYFGMVTARANAHHDLTVPEEVSRFNHNPFSKLHGLTHRWLANYPSLDNEIAVYGLGMLAAGGVGVGVALAFLSYALAGWIAVGLVLAGLMAIAMLAGEAGNQQTGETLTTAIRVAQAVENPSRADWQRLVGLMESGQRILRGYDQYSVGRGQQARVVSYLNTEGRAKLEQLSTALEGLQSAGFEKTRENYGQMLALLAIIPTVENPNEALFVDVFPGWTAEQMQLMFETNQKILHLYLSEGCENQCFFCGADKSFATLQHMPFPLAVKIMRAVKGYADEVFPYLNNDPLQYQDEVAGADFADIAAWAGKLGYPKITVSSHGTLVPAHSNRVVRALQRLKGITAIRIRSQFSVHLFHDDVIRYLRVQQAGDQSPEQLRKTREALIEAHSRRLLPFIRAAIASNQNFNFIIYRTDEHLKEKLGNQYPAVLTELDAVQAELWKRISGRLDPKIMAELQKKEQICFSSIKWNGTAAVALQRLGLKNDLILKIQELQNHERIMPTAYWAFISPDGRASLLAPEAQGERSRTVGEMFRDPDSRPFHQFVELLKASLALDSLPRGYAPLLPASSPGDSMGISRKPVLKPRSNQLTEDSSHQRPDAMQIVKFIQGHYLGPQLRLEIEKPVPDFPMIYAALKSMPFPAVMTVLYQVWGAEAAQVLRQNMPPNVAERFDVLMSETLHVVDPNSGPGQLDPWRSSHLFPMPKPVFSPSAIIQNNGLIQLKTKFRAMTHVSPGFWSSHRYLRFIPLALAVALFGQSAPVRADQPGRSRDTSSLAAGKKQSQQNPVNTFTEDHLHYYGFRLDKNHPLGKISMPLPATPAGETVQFLSFRLELGGRLRPSDIRIKVEGHQHGITKTLQFSLNDPAVQIHDDSQVVIDLGPAGGLQSASAVTWIAGNERFRSEAPSAGDDYVVIEDLAANHFIAGGVWTNLPEESRKFSQEGTVSNVSSSRDGAVFEMDFDGKMQRRSIAFQPVLPSGGRLIKSISFDIDYGQLNPGDITVAPGFWSTMVFNQVITSRSEQELPKVMKNQHVVLEKFNPSEPLMGNMTLRFQARTKTPVHCKVEIRNLKIEYEAPYHPAGPWLSTGQAGVFPTVQVAEQTTRFAWNLGPGVLWQGITRRVETGGRLGLGQVEFELAVGLHKPDSLTLRLESGDKKTFDYTLENPQSGFYALPVSAFSGMSTAAPSPVRLQVLVSRRETTAALAGTLEIKGLRMLPYQPSDKPLTSGVKNISVNPGTAATALVTWASGRKEEKTIAGRITDESVIKALRREFISDYTLFLGKYGLQKVYAVKDLSQPMVLSPDHAVLLVDEKDRARINGIAHDVLANKSGVAWAIGSAVPRWPKDLPEVLLKNQPPRPTFFIGGTSLFTNINQAKLEFMIASIKGRLLTSREREELKDFSSRLPALEKLKWEVYAKEGMECSEIAAAFMQPLGATGLRIMRSGIQAPYKKVYQSLSGIDFHQYLIVALAGVNFVLDGSADQFEWVQQGKEKIGLLDLGIVMVPEMFLATDLGPNLWMYSQGNGSVYRNEDHETDYELRRNHPKNVAKEGLEEREINQALEENFKQGSILSISDRQLDSLDEQAMTRLTARNFMDMIVSNIENRAGVDHKNSAKNYWEARLLHNPQGPENLAALQQALRFLKNNRGPAGEDFRYVIPMGNRDVFDQVMVLGHAGSQVKTLGREGIRSVFLSRHALLAAEVDPVGFAALIRHEQMDLREGKHQWRNGEEPVIWAFWGKTREIAGQDLTAGRLARTEMSGPVSEQRAGVSAPEANTQILYQPGAWLRIPGWQRFWTLLLQAMTLRWEAAGQAADEASLNRDPALRLKAMASCAAIKVELQGYFAHPQQIRFEILSPGKHGLLNWMKGLLYGHAEVNQGQMTLCLPRYLCQALLNKTPEASGTRAAALDDFQAMAWMAGRAAAVRQLEKAESDVLLLEKEQRPVAARMVPRFIGQWLAPLIGLGQGLIRGFVKSSPINAWQQVLAGLPAMVRNEAVWQGMISLALNSDLPLARAYRRLARDPCARNQAEFAQILAEAIETGQNQRTGDPVEMAAKNAMDWLAFTDICRNLGMPLSEPVGILDLHHPAYGSVAEAGQGRAVAFPKAWLNPEHPHFPAIGRILMRLEKGPFEVHPERGPNFRRLPTRFESKA
jgi:hypothetical protein